MKTTYDLNASGCLIITATDAERQEIRYQIDNGKSEVDLDEEILQTLVETSTFGLCHVEPEECGDLTAAPMLGLRDENGVVTSRWAFMDYQVRLISEDLRDYGKAIFTGGTV